MRILHIIDGIGVGGAESVLVQMIEQFEGLGIHNIILSMTRVGVLRERIIASGAELVEVELTKGKMPIRQLRQLVNEVNQARPDLIQAWMYHGNLAAMILRVLSRQRKPMIWSVHNTLEPAPKFAPVTRMAYWGCRVGARLASRIVYVSQLSADQHEARGFPRSKTQFIPNGTDCEVYKPDPIKRQILRDAWGVTDDTIVFGCFARWDPMKGHSILLEATAKLKAEQIPIRLIFAGTGMTSENTELQTLVESKQLSANSLFLGERQDIPELMTGLDAFVLPSIYGEAFPMVLGEAMACEVPCIATDVGDVCRLLGPIGNVIPPSDAEALSSSMRDFMLSSKEERDTEGARARTYIIQNYSLKRMIEEYISLYDSIAGGDSSLMLRQARAGHSTS